MHLSLFLPLLLSPAVLRDTQERGRRLEQVLDQYTNFVKPAFEEFTLPVSRPAQSLARPCRGELLPILSLSTD